MQIFQDIYANDDVSEGGIAMTKNPSRRNYYFKNRAERLAYTRKYYKDNPDKYQEMLKKQKECNERKKEGLPSLREMRKHQKRLEKILKVKSKYQRAWQERYASGYTKRLFSDEYFKEKYG